MADRVGNFQLHIVLYFFVFFVTIHLNKEDRGRSAHGWSSQMRVGSLFRIGCEAEKQGT